MKDFINRVIRWLLYVLIFYHVLFLIAGGVGFLIKGADLSILAEVLILLVVIVLSSFMAIQINKRITAVLETLSFTIRLVLTGCALLLLIVTLPVLINMLPDRI